MGRFASRFWDGAVWTDDVVDADGAATSDPLSGQAPASTTGTPADEAGLLHETLQRAMTAYAGLLEEAGANGMDDATFSKRAMGIGLIVRENDAWLFDVPSGRWFRYDGVHLSPLGGWDQPAPSQGTTS